MAITIKQLFAAVRAVEIPIGADVLHVEYRTAMLTPAVISAAQEMASLPQIEQINAMIGILSALVAGWDLLGDDGAPLATTAETMRALPVAFLAQVLSAIVADMGADKDAPKS